MVNAAIGVDPEDRCTGALHLYSVYSQRHTLLMCGTTGWLVNHDRYKPVRSGAMN
jgi:hypothetical protein